ncbi:MAG: hypothetical protein QOD26_3763 [Betaproteobacteria bacterium]|nr:hypothetical protein [Betaproteobacteria bacterium]
MLVLPPIEPPVLGAGVGLGDLVVELSVEPLPVELDELPVPVEPEELLVPPLEELEPDLLKWASHSEREIWPSLLLSMDEKLGCEALPELELGELELEVPPLADGLLLDEEESAATASVERAKSAAAVVTVTDLSI